MHGMKLLLPALAIASPAAALAADPAPTALPSEHRLSPAEVERILEEAARKNRAAADPAAIAQPAPEPEGSRYPIHGEVGFAIGTGGYRSTYGTVYAPLPGDGLAILSFENSRLRDRDFDYFDYGQPVAR